MNIYRDIVGKFSYWSALVMMFSLFAPMYFARIAIVVWASFWLLEFRWLGRKNISFDKTLLCVGGFLLIYLIELLSSLWTIHSGETSGILSRQVYLLAVVLPLVFGVNDYYKPKNMLYAMMIGAVFFSVLYYFTIYCSASYNMMWENGKDNWQKIELWQYGDRLHVFKHHAYFSLALLIAGISSCFVRGNVERVEGKWSSYLLVALYCVAVTASIYVSGTRATLIALPVLLFVFLAFKFKRNIWIVALAGTLFVGAFGYVVLKNHFHSKTSVEVMTNAVEEGSDPRFKIWKAAADIAPDYFFFGSGAGTNKIRLTQYYAQEHYPITFMNKRLGSHNQYIGIFLDLGIFALVVYVASLFLIHYYHTNRRTRLFALLVSSAIAFQMMFENMTDRTEGIVILCAMLMLINWMHRCDNKGIEW